MAINFKYLHPALPLVVAEEMLQAMALGLCSEGEWDGATAKATHWVCFTPTEIKLFRSMNSVIYFGQT